MKKWNNIKAVFFDFDDTLGNREKYAYDCARDILKENSSIDDPVLFEAVLQDWMLWDEKGNIDKNYVKERLQDKYHILIPCEDMNACWDERLWKYTVPFPDAGYTLSELSQKYILGLITNGPSDGQHNKLIKSGLDSYFDTRNVTVSGDYPFAKPDIRIFQTAMHKAGVSPEESVYVGDIFANDISGALHAGMHAVWIWNWGERECGLDVPVIHHISELLGLL